MDLVMPELVAVFTQPDARDLILEAALAAFAEHGFHGASMRDIAARAGVSQSLLHHHFGTKDALWNLVGERISTDFLNYMADDLAPGVPAAEAVPRALRRYMAYWKERPSAFRFNLWRLLEGPVQERRARSKALNARTVPLFQRAQKAGLLRADLPAGLAMIIGGGLIQFWLHSRLEIRDALAVTGAALPTDDAFIEVILGLIGPPASKQRSGRRK
jgi:AcrR family transcriptional regulator